MSQLLCGLGRGGKPAVPVKFIAVETIYSYLILPIKEGFLMDTLQLFESWRAIGRQYNSWGLAWFLAYQYCRRFYASHGIVPHVIEREGLGYYGIQLDYLPCKVNITGNATETLGRITISGDVENWRTGGPGDHGLDTFEQCQKGVSTEELISNALAHMALPTTPNHSHVSCRHKRWGDSYALVFEIATILALRNPENFQIWNHPYHTEKLILEFDTKNTLIEHPGAFVFSRNSNKVVVAGDGRLLDHSNRNLWKEYMSGKSPFTLAISIEAEVA